MAISYILGDTLVDQKEIQEKISDGVFSKFNQAVSKGHEAQIDFKHGTFRSSEIEKLPGPSVPKPTSIGIGKPLSIEILCAYSGNAPIKLFGGKKDLLLVSGVKTVSSHDEAPRAINQVSKRVANFKYFQPSAFDIGCPMVYYSPALDSGTLFCSIEMVAETFPQKVFDMIAQLFSKAGGIPVFGPASVYLLAGSSVIKIAGSLGKKLFETEAFLDGTANLRLDTPGFPVEHIHQLMVHDKNDRDTFNDYEPALISSHGHHRVAMIHKSTGKEYTGPAPYVILSIDGRDRNTEMKGFASKYATAAILEKFYGKNDTENSTEIIETALVLYNDLKFYKKALDMQKELTKYPDDSEEYKEKLKYLEAYKANIINDQFKL